MNKIGLTADEILAIDRKHIWHPYSSIHSSAPLYVVEEAHGSRIHLKTGEVLIDGMSSWWSTLHGYNHPELNQAIASQTEKMAHVMFGGLTHEPAAKLAKQLVDISPEPLQHVFFSDSGSVAVEVAMKMAIQYWVAKKQNRTRFLTIKNGYHGDTFAAMSVCDPVTGMHGLFSDAVKTQLFAERPARRFHETWQDHDFDNFENLFIQNHTQLAAVVLEPIVQGTGGMYFYSPVFLKKVREICSEYKVPLITDEIATGLGRTGRMFACEHADISPDIMCLGKTLSAGYITLAATLCSEDIATTICAADPGVFMHGPTFMANPLACAVASKSLDLLAEDTWQSQLRTIEKGLIKGLSPCRALPGVSDVRVLGSIGVVELEEPVSLEAFQPLCIENGIWLRPFGKLVYMMPAYNIDEKTLATLCKGTCTTLIQFLNPT